MPKLTQPTPLNAEEQRLYSESLLNLRAPHLISKAEPSHPAMEAHFSRLYSHSHSFGLYSDLKTIGESWEIDQLIESFAFWLSSLFPTTDHFSVRITAKAAPIRLSISCSIFPSFMNKTRRNFTSSTWKQLSHDLRFRGADPNPRCFKLSCKVSRCELESTVRWGQWDHVICK